MHFAARTKKIKSGLSQAGQGMTEYIIIVALIAVAAIGVYSMFGQTIRQQVAGLAGEVAGTGSSAQIKAAGVAASAAASKAAASKGMNTYGN
jgi:Flp pilus assembly pilin Flp